MVTEAEIRLLLVSELRSVGVIWFYTVLNY